MAIEGHPKYFNFYETETAADLTSAAYQARLNDPTPWTKSVVAHFTDTSRTICDVAWSTGIGEGAAIGAIQLETSTAAEAFQEAMKKLVGEALTAVPGIVGLHLLRGHAAAGPADTVEKRLRGVPDKLAAWILLFEAVGLDALRGFRSQACSDRVLTAAGASSITSGVYQLQFALTKSELAKARQSA